MYIAKCLLTQRRSYIQARILWATAGAVCMLDYVALI